MRTVKGSIQSNKGSGWGMASGLVSLHVKEASWAGQLSSLEINSPCELQSLQHQEGPRCQSIRNKMA